MTIYTPSAHEKSEQTYSSRSSASEASDSLNRELSSASSLLNNYQSPRLPSWNPERIAKLINGTSSQRCKRARISNEDDRSSEMIYRDVRKQPRSRRESSDSSSTSSTLTESNRSERSLLSYSSNTSLKLDNPNDYESESPGDLSDNESEPIFLEMNTLRISDESELYNPENDEEGNFGQMYQEQERIERLTDGFRARRHKGVFY